MRNHAISFTERGILRVLPFLPSVDFTVLTLLPPSFSLTVFSATFLPAAVAFDAAAFDFEAAFLAVDLVLVAAFLAAAFVFVAAFFAVVLALVAVFFAVFLAAVFFLETMLSNFFEITALNPALTRPFWPAFTIPAGDLIPASLSFFAVAFPTPGNAIRVARGSFFGLAAISSPNTCMSRPHDEPFSHLGALFKGKPRCDQFMQGGLDPLKSILFAQVRVAGPTHGYDLEGYLRPRAHPANISTVYLGDVAQTLLKVIQGISTPIMDSKPGFDEQTWKFSSHSGDLSVTVESYSYWGFGLLTRCYANTIILEGPLNERARIIFDLVASLPHKPWEFSWNGKFNSKISDVKNNQFGWQSHIGRAKEDLNELIETTLLAKGNCDDIEIARNALADDNAPAVLRALARIEAESIEIKVEDVSPDGMTLNFDEEIPFVDLSSEEE